MKELGRIAFQNASLEHIKGVMEKQWLLDLLWNSLRKNTQRDSGGKGRTCYYCWKEGQLKGDCPQVSKLPHVRSARTALQKRRPPRHRPQGLDSQGNQGWRCPGVLTQVPILITLEEPMRGQSVDFLLDTRANFSVLAKAPGPLFSQSTTIMALSGRAKHYYFSHPLSHNRDSVLLSRISNHAKVSLTPSGERYTEQGSAFCFHEYGTCSFNWRKCKS